MTLTLHGAEVSNVFSLVGLDENGASYALGWTLSQSQKLRDLVVAKTFGAQLDAADAAITLQKRGRDGSPRGRLCACASSGFPRRQNSNARPRSSRRGTTSPSSAT